MVLLVKLDFGIWVFFFIVYYNVYVGYVNFDVAYLKFFKSLVFVILIIVRIVFKGVKDVIYFRNLSC